MKAIVLAGGTGTRLWPLSRSKYPKQFIRLNGMDQSLFQMTINRCLEFCELRDIYIVANKQYDFIVLNQIASMGFCEEEIHLLLEPVAKNTLPAVYNAVKVILENDDDTIVVLPSDHLTEDGVKFSQKIMECAPLTEEYIFTFGIKPTFPETGYGYIKPGKKLEVGFCADQFNEKPSYELAKKFLEKGFLWNSGMFMFKASVFENEVKIHTPDLFQAFKHDQLEECFKFSPNISIDKGIMEKSSRVAVLPIDIRWNDLGTFTSFFDTYKGHMNSNGNILSKKHIPIDSKNNLIYTTTDKVCAIIGVNDLIVIEKDDALLICNKNYAQDVKKVVSELQLRNDRSVEYNLTEYRPWGSFTILEECETHKVKRLTVLPRKKLSYQMHLHRNEKWIVVKGIATIIINDIKYQITKGGNISIDMESKHRLINDSDAILEVIEIQTGSYFGEDDIVRFEDDFGRCE